MEIQSVSFFYLFFSPADMPRDWMLNDSKKISKGSGINTLFIKNGDFDKSSFEWSLKPRDYGGSRFGVAGLWALLATPIDAIPEVSDKTIIFSGGQDARRRKSKTR